MPSSPPQSRTILTTLVFLVLPLSGCLGDDGSDDPAPGSSDYAGSNVDAMLESVEQQIQEGISFEQTVAINLVFVGTPEDLYDEEAIQERMGPYFSPRIPFDDDTAKDVARSPLFFEFDYRFHRAPDAFGEGLFAYADSIGEEVAAPGFLQEYDDMYQFDRLEDGDTIALFDAPKVEQWMADHRAEYGLEFEKPEYTLFILDSYSSDWWHHDSYYWYKYDDIIPSEGNEETSVVYDNDPREPGGDSKNLRVWGGLQDFLFLDISAAPNDAGDDNSAPLQVFPANWLNPAPASEGTAYNDPPVWHYDANGEAQVGAGGNQDRTLNAIDPLVQNIRSAVHMRFVPTYLYPPVYKPEVQINMHLYHDGASIIPKTLEEYADFEVMMDGLRQQVPWAKINGDLHTYVLPDDDPGMNEALAKAKAHGAGNYIPAAPIMNHIDGHPEQYTSNDPNVFDVKAFFFIFQGHQTIALPAIVGGIALGDTDGHAWGTISNINDARYLQGGDPKQAFVGINLHEVGHFFGLRHPHDGDCTTPEGEYCTITTDFTWGSIASALSYRIRTWTSDNMDRDSLARVHTYQNIRDTYREAQTVYHVLQDQGISRTPGDVLALLADSQDKADAARTAYAEGHWTDAVPLAIEARRLAMGAVDAAGGAPIKTVDVGGWDGSGLSSKQVKVYPLTDTGSVGNTEAFFDYQQVSFSPAAESITVKVSFTNTEDSWGDLFVGWAPACREPPAELSYESTRVRTFNAFGVKDFFDEQAGDGEHVLEHTVELDRFPDMLRQGKILVGTGTQGSAQDATYRVDVSVNYRDWGSGSDQAELSPDIDEELLPQVERRTDDQIVPVTQFMAERGL